MWERDQEWTPSERENPWVAGGSSVLKDRPTFEATRPRESQVWETARLVSRTPALALESALGW